MLGGESRSMTTKELLLYHRVIADYSIWRCEFVHKVFEAVKPRDLI
jgi:hypothetical protein